MTSQGMQICEHLKSVADYLVCEGGHITYSGKAWSNQIGFWLYFDLMLNCDSLLSKFDINKKFKVHEHIGTHSGSEFGLICQEHGDAIMGVHPNFRRDEKIVS